MLIMKWPDITFPPINLWSYPMQTDLFKGTLNEQIGGDHYKKLKIEPIEYIMANQIGFCEGSAIKYLTRWKDKGGVEDLYKARHFIDILIDAEETKNET